MNATSSEAPDEPGPSDRVGNNPAYLCFTDTVYIDHCDVGLGVFATRDIELGEILLTIEGPLIDFAETKRRGPRECMAIQIGCDLYVDTQAPGVLVNHSCDPNSGIRNDRYLVALRPLRKGQEIRWDYSTTMEEQSFTMRCLCGSPRCRGTVRDFSTLPPEVQAEYLEKRIVMGFIADRYARQSAVYAQALAMA